jgi:hypothetical protein
MTSSTLPATAEVLVARACQVTKCGDKQFRRWINGGPLIDPAGWSRASEHWGGPLERKDNKEGLQKGYARERRTRLEPCAGEEKNHFYMAEFESECELSYNAEAALGRAEARLVFRPHLRLAATPS